jgi:phytol kinase
MAEPWLGMVLVVGSLAGLIAELGLWRRHSRPHPELTRKLVHIGMGAVALAFPWLFTQSWPVVVLAFLCIGGLLGLRVSRLREDFGGVLGDVGRGLPGEICYAAGVAALFILHLGEGGPSDRRLLLYFVPLLVLAVADAAAALVGVYHGQRLYRVPGGWKTVEGSVAFLVCAFVCTLVPLLLLTEATFPEALLVATLLAWLTTLIEAVAWHGLDNLLLPVAGFLLLQVILAADPVGLLGCLGLSVLLTGLLGLCHWRQARQDQREVPALSLGTAGRPGSALGFRQAPTRADAVQ